MSSEFDMSGSDLVSKVINRPARFANLTPAQKQVIEDKMMSYLCYSDEEENEESLLESDNDFAEEEDASDLENENVTLVDAEEVDDNYETSEDEFDTDNGDSDYPQSHGEHYSSKAGIIWTPQAPPPGRPRAHNVTVPSRAGPNSSFLPSHVHIFKKIITPEMVDIIVRETNHKAQEAYLAWKSNYPTTKIKDMDPTSVNEMYAFFGLLLFAGVFKCSTQPTKELWAPYHHDVYKATMSHKRFKFLLRFIRFDKSSTRQERQILSKSAPIDDIWIMLNSNLESSYTPGANLTVDEQLFPYRGRTGFRQYIPSKPAKYGIKVWWICDAHTNYPLKGQIYTGKSPEGVRDTNQGERVVMDLARKFFHSGRTIYCDNFFTSLKLAQNLMEVRLAIVGTVRSNKAFVPIEFKKSKDRTEGETLFGYYDDKYALCSYVPKKNKSVIMLSTQHYGNSIVQYITKEDEPGRPQRLNNAKKPNQILDYNRFKAGVDTMDQMISNYSCKRATNRWPLAMFFNILDIAGLASFLIYKEMTPTVKQSDFRRKYLIDLATQLVTPHMEKRATNRHVTRSPNIRNAMAKFNVNVPQTSRNLESVHSELAISNSPNTTYRPLCVKCNTTTKTKRKTRFYCGVCSKAMCLQHGKESKTYICDDCQ